MIINWITLLCDSICKHLDIHRNIYTFPETLSCHENLFGSIQIFSGKAASVHHGIPTMFWLWVWFSFTEIVSFKPEAHFPESVHLFFHQSLNHFMRWIVVFLLTAAFALECSHNAINTFLSCFIMYTDFNWEKSTAGAIKCFSRSFYDLFCDATKIG